MEEVIYNSNHKVEVFNKNGISGLRNTLIKITRNHHNALHVKVRDLEDFSFNFTTEINYTSFEEMKIDQCLEIIYDDFYLHLIELLKQTQSKDMFLRLEIYDGKCRMMFYEKSKIKLLVFLIIELTLTDQIEIINEMAGSIAQLKEINKMANSQVASLKCQLQEKAGLLNAAVAGNNHFKTQFCKDVEVIEDTFTKTLCAVERNICIRVEKLNKRHMKILHDLDLVKKENSLKGTALIHTVRQLEQAKRENEKHLKTTDALRAEINSLNFMKIQADKNFIDLRETVVKKDKEIEIFNKRITELQKDINEATIIIAQKTKTQDEIGKDLVQANTMLVNFNNQFDLMANELDKMREALCNKEKIIRDQTANLQKISEDFAKYKFKYNEEETKRLNHELLLAKQKLEELEKQNREAAKINGLLTKKLTNGDIFDSRNMNFMHPK